MIKFKVGDKVRVEFTIDSIDSSDGGLYANLNLTRRTMWCDGILHKSGVATHKITEVHPAIVKHIPKPYEPKVGDIVRYDKGSYILSPKYYIRHIIGEYAWVECEESLDKVNQYIVPIDKLFPA